MKRNLAFRSIMSSTLVLIIISFIFFFRGCIYKSSILDLQDIESLSLGDNIVLVQQKLPMQIGDSSTRSVRLASNFILRKGLALQESKKLYWIDDYYYLELHFDANDKLQFIFLTRSDSSFLDFILP